jgi:hypothetical protein
MCSLAVRRVVVGGLTFASAVACGAGNEGRGGGVSYTSIASISVSGTDSNDSMVEDDDGSETEESASSMESGPSSGDEGAKFDLGVMPDQNLEIEEGCKKVDFLFVIDDSGSMGDDQANLAAEFPDFITGIQATLEDVDEYQVGVVATDAYPYNIGGCNVLGGLVSKTGGDQSSNATCGPYAEGHNFMTEQDDLGSKFACAAKVGVEGDPIERPMNAMEAAVRKDHGGPGECNEGFLRDDALLVIVVITDEWDGPNDPEFGGSSGDAQSWYDTVVTAKGGIPENVVVLLLHHIPGMCDPPEIYSNGQHIIEFVTMFGPNGFLGCITGDFGAIFGEATGIIQEACDNFMPPG